MFSENIEFENVPIVTPNGDILVRSLSFSIKHGVSVSMLLLPLLLRRNFSNIF